MELDHRSTKIEYWLLSSFKKSVCSCFKSWGLPLEDTRLWFYYCSCIGKSHGWPFWQTLICVDFQALFSEMNIFFGNNLSMFLRVNWFSDLDYLAFWNLSNLQLQLDLHVYLICWTSLIIPLDTIFFFFSDSSKSLKVEYFCVMGHLDKNELINPYFYLWMPVS